MTIGTSLSATGNPKYASVAEMKTIALQSGSTVETISRVGGWAGSSIIPTGGAVYNIVTLTQYTAITGNVAADEVADYLLNNGNVAMLDNQHGYRTSQFATFADAVSVTSGVELIVDSNEVVTANITVSGPSLRFELGGKLSPNTGVVVTLNCPIIAGDYEIFDQNALGLILGTFGGAILNTAWWGTVADSDGAGGGTDNRALFQKAIAAAPNGGIVEFGDGNYRCSDYLALRPEAATGRYYVHFRGRTSVGYSESCKLVFDAVCADGIRIDNATGGYQRVSNCTLLQAGTRVAADSDPDSGTLGAGGLHYAGIEHSPSEHAHDIQILNFDAGIIVDIASGTDQIFNRFNNIRMNACVVGIIYLGGTSATFSQCIITNSLKYGVFLEDTYGFSFDGGGMEENGTRDPNFTVTPNADYYGIYLKGNARATITNTYIEGQTCYVAEGSTLTLDTNRIALTNKIFGLGEINYPDASPNLIPHDITALYAARNHSTLTDQTYYHRVQKAYGTAAGILVDNLDIASSVSILDVIAGVYSVDIKIVAGFADASFDIDPFIQFTQSDTSSDSSDKTIAFNEAPYDWTDGNWHRINFYWVPRYAGRLNPLVDDLEKLTWSISVTSGSFTTNPLDMHVRYPSLKLLTKSDIGPEHSLFAGAQSLNKFNVQKKIVTLSLSGATTTWTGAIPAGAYIMGITARVAVAAVGATTINIGDGTTPDLFQTALAVAAGSSGTLANSGAGFTGPQLYKSVSNIIATAVGGAANFSAGELELEMYYITLSAPVA